MPVAVACPKCKKKYSLPDKMLGKVVKCSKCNAKFKTPAAKAPVKAQTAKVATNPQIAKAQAASNAHAAEMKKLGIDGPIRRAPDLFAGAVKPRKGEADPLANHVIADPGFAQVDMPQQEVEVAHDPLADMYSNPALQQEQTSSDSRIAAGKGKNKKKSSGDFASKVWLWIVAILAPLFLLGIILSFFAPGAASTVVSIGLGLLSLVNTAVGIWLLIETSKVSQSIVQVLLVLFLPFYVLYFLIKNWSEMKNVGNAIIAQVFVGILAAIAFVVAIGTAIGGMVPQ